MRLGLILRPPTRTPGFRGMGYTFAPPVPRIPRASRLGRLRWYDRSLAYLGQDSGDYTTLPLTAPSGDIPLMPLSPAVSTGQDILNAMKVQATIDQNPTDYVSPQAAIAAGLDPTAVNAAWAAGLARFATQQDAIAAGIAPTVITTLWNQSRMLLATRSTSTTPSWMTPNNLLIGGGLLFAASVLLRGSKGRR